MKYLKSFFFFFLLLSSSFFSFFFPLFPLPTEVQNLPREGTTARHSTCSRARVLACALRLHKLGALKRRASATGTRRRFTGYCTCTGPQERRKRLEIWSAIKTLLKEDHTGQCVVPPSFEFHPSSLSLSLSLCAMQRPDARETRETRLSYTSKKSAKYGLVWERDAEVSACRGQTTCS